MKRVLLILPMIAVVALCQAQSLRVVVENPSKFDRSAEIVEIPLGDVFASVPMKNKHTLVVKDSKGGFVPMQVTSDKKLIFQAGTAAQATAEYEVTLVPAAKAPEYKALAYGRFVPERLDDYVWENDRVAFRIYGPALIQKDGPSNGIDLWYKRTNELIADKWYKAYNEEKLSYHKDHGTGLDDYKVGRSLGAGAMAPYVDGKLVMNDNFVSYETLDNGPLRFAAKFVYHDMEIKGEKVAEIRTISLDAGSQYTKVVQEFGTGKPMEVAAGIVKRANNSEYTASDDYVIYTNVEGEYAGEVYVGMVLPSGIKYTGIDTYAAAEGPTKGSYYSHVLAIADYEPGEPVTYYAGFGWHMFGFPTMGDFRDYTKNFAAALKEPLVVKYEMKK